MNSMMPIAAHITPRGSSQNFLAVALDACASGSPDDRRMHGSRGQHHAVSRLQFHAASLAVEHEGDRPVDAVKDLLVAVVVSGVAVTGAVRPRVAAARLRLEPGHQLDQLVGGSHGPILRLLACDLVYWPNAT